MSDDAGCSDASDASSRRSGYANAASSADALSGRIRSLIGGDAACVSAASHQKAVQLLGRLFSFDAPSSRTAQLTMLSICAALLRRLVRTQATLEHDGEQHRAWRRTLSRIQEMSSEAYVSRARRRQSLKQRERQQTAQRLQQMAEDGFDFAAFAALCKQSGLKVPEARLLELFEQADVDHSGKIDRDEVHTLTQLLSVRAEADVESKR